MNIVLIVLGIVFLISLILLLRVNKKGLKVILGSVISLCVIVFCALEISPLLDKIKYGLDLQGGFEVLYQIEPLREDQQLDSSMVYSTYKAILKRIDILGVNEPEITIEGDNRIRIGLAGVTNEKEARDIISSTAVLSFRDYYDNLLMTSDVLGGSAKVTTDNYGKPAVSLSIKDTDTFFNVTKKVKDMSENVIVIWLDFEEGEDSYRNEKYKCGSLSTSKCLSAAQVNQAFSSDVIIQGNFTLEEASSLVELINSGALPSKLVELSSRTVEATYGEASLNKTLIAGLIGIVLVIILMIVIYHFAGFIASFGLVLYTFLSLLTFYLIEGTLTLPGMAAMLLGIGMAVDASVISYERIKEELKIGKKLGKAVELGNKQSFTSIIDANITTIIVAIILFIFGQSSVKGFATMLIINIIITILVLVFLSRFIVKLFVKTGYFDNKLNFFIGVKNKQIKKQEYKIIPYQKLDFVKSRSKVFIITGVIIAIGAIFTFVKGLNLGVDFTGGTSITVNNSDKVTYEKLVSELDNYTIKKTEINNNSYLFVTEELLSKDEINALSNSLEEKYDTETDIFVVSDVVKKELVKNAIYSLVIAIIGIVIYVSFRFKFNYAISGIIALLHDVIITVIFFSIFRIEINSIFIAAILTIIGYSINDTIVTFDMIRENYRNRYKNNITNKEDLTNLVNDSVRLTLFRSIITTVTTLLPVISLMLLGAYEIINFNIALLVGFIAGVYSSIFISNQIWYLLEVKSIKKPKKKKENHEIEELQIKGINC